jgi:hypothetical protein
MLTISSDESNELNYNKQYWGRDLRQNIDANLNDRRQTKNTLGGNNNKKDRSAYAN